MNRLKIAVAVGLFVASVVGNATTITFNKLILDSAPYYDSRNYSYDYRPVNPIIDSLGFRFSGGDPENHSYLGVWPKDSPYQADYVGHAAVFTPNSWTTTTMTALDSTSFDFYAIGLADVYNVGATPTLAFTFNYASGSPSSQSVTLNAEPGLQTVVFDQHELTSVSWMGISGDNGWYQFDNVMTAPVPEPETCAMLAAGLGLLGVLARRKKRMAAA